MAGRLSTCGSGCELHHASGTRVRIQPAEGGRHRGVWAMAALVSRSRNEQVATMVPRASGGGTSKAAPVQEGACSSKGRRRRRVMHSDVQKILHATCQVALSVGYKSELGRTERRSVAQSSWIVLSLAHTSMPYIDYKALKERFDVEDALRHLGFLDHFQEDAHGALKGPCPVHSTGFEGSSFKVTASRRGFRCFGCGAQGNVLDLVAATQSGTINQAAQQINQWLAGEPAAQVVEDSPSVEPVSEATRYQEHVFSGLPVYSVRLVRETTVTSQHYRQCRLPSEVADFLRLYYAERDREEFVTVLLDTALHVTGIASISIGGLANTVVEPAQVFKPAILGNAQSVILAHNHPSGNSEPSREDVAITRQMVECGKLLLIPVRDHLIITDHSFVSLAERGLIGG